MLNEWRLQPQWNVHHQIVLPNIHPLMHCCNILFDEDVCRLQFYVDRYVITFDVVGLLCAEYRGRSVSVCI